MSERVVFDKMIYDHLIKIFYKNPSEHEKIYIERFNASTTRHFPFNIKQFNRKKEFQIFFCYTEKFVLLSEIIYKKYVNFLQLMKTVPPIVLEQFKLSCIIDEVKSSNSIEGVNSTRREISDILQGVSNTSRISSIVNKYYALMSGEHFNFKTCEELRNFYNVFIYEEIATNNPKCKLDGKLFRKDSVDITSATEKILHRGSYPEEKIIKNMNEALRILNDENIPFLVRVSIFHYLFGYIHPFYDGNGRTSRFITAYFISENFHYLPALKLSLTIKRQRKKYYDLFEETNSEINCGDLTPFVLGFVEIISDTFDNIEFALNKKITLLLSFQERLKPLLPKDELLKEIYEVLLQSALFFPYGVSMEELMRWTGKARNTIKSRLRYAPKDEILTLKSGKRNFYKLNMMMFLR